MSIEELATSFNDLENELSDLEIDMFASEEEKEKKEKERDNVRNQLLFYNEFKELYENNEKCELDSTLLYPFVKEYNEKGELVFKRKDTEEYKENVDTYLEQLEEAYKEGKIDEKTYKKMRKDAINLADKQMERIEKEEKEETKDVDLKEEYENTLESIEETKKSYIYNQIGEQSYGALQVQYKNMPEIDRKILLRKTHEGICTEMGIACDLDFTKYGDLKDESTVTKDGYCIKTRDLNNMPYPLDTIILEQVYKLHMKEILNSRGKYDQKQKDRLIKMLMDSLVNQKRIVFEKAKRKELNLYDF